MTTPPSAPRHLPTPAGKSHKRVRLSVLVPITVFLLGLVAAGTLGIRQHDAKIEAMGAAVDAVADSAADDLQRRMKLYEYGLRGARGAVPVDGQATPEARERYRDYVMSRDLEAEFPGARGFAYVQRVAPGREAAFLAGQREGGTRDFTLQSLSPNTGERFVVTYIEPLERNHPALGLDIASEPARRDAARAAMASGQAMLTGPINLIQSRGEPGYSMLLLLPVYRGGVTPPPEQRAALGTGWVFAPLVTAEFLGESADRSYSVELRDVTDPGAPVVLNELPAQGAPAAAAFDRQRQFPMYGRRWELIIHPSRALLARQNITSPLTVASTTLGGASLLALILLLGLSARERRLRVFNRRARMAAIAESSHDAIIATDADGRVTEWNAAATGLFGYESGQALDVSLVELIVPFEQVREDARVMASALAGEAVVALETVRRHQDGHLIEVELSTAPIRRAKRGVAGVAMTIRDIRDRNRTARKLQELNTNLERLVRVRTAQLEESSVLRRAVLNNAGYCIIATDPAGAITLFNPAAEQMLGVAAADALGDSIERFHDPHEMAIRAMHSEAELGRPVAVGFDALIARAHEAPEASEWTYVAASGRRIPALVTISALRRDDGALLGYLGIAVDLTARKAREAALKLSESKLRGLFELSPLGIVLTGRDGAFVESNPAFQSLVGYSPDELHSMRHSEITPAEYEPHDRAVLGTLERTGSYGPHEKHYVRKDGTRVPVRLNGMMLEIQDQRYVWSIVEDITVQRTAESAMVGAVADAEAASRAKSDFLANMSHEIRTPMHAILGMLKLLQRTPLDPRQRDYAANTEQAASTLLAILNDILDFSKIEAGHLSLEAQDFSLDSLLRNLATILGSNVGDKDMEVVYSLDPAIPPQLTGDSLRLQQVLINLAGNAVKFTHYGEVVVSARVVSRAEQQVSIRFEVRDTGIGIAADKLETIFEGFTQAEASTTRRFGGTGLGLAISRNLVGLMGGELAVESERGMGSRFHFTLDFQIAADPALDTDAAAIPVRAGVSGPMKALVVDDNHSARESIREMLASLGWDVDVASGGQEGLDSIEAARAAGQAYGVVFLDWRMPDMDGWETSQRIRAGRADGAEPLIVMVTAHGRELLSERSAAETSALDGFLMKPVTVSMLLDAVAGVHGLDRDADAEAPSLPEARRLAGMRILVVEDNPANQQVVDELLTAEGAEITIASGGAIALQLLAGEPTRYDVVLMDIQMPDMDGYTATRRIRAMAGFDALPIVAMTANVQASDREASFAAGMNDHIGKPFELDDVITRLRHWTNAPAAADGGKTAGSPAPVAPPQPASSRGPGTQAAPAPSAAAGNAPEVLNVAATLRRFAGNRAALDGNLDRFSGAARAVHASLVEAHAAADREAVLRHLHTLYGLAGIAGAEQLAALARHASGLAAAVEGEPQRLPDAAVLARIATAIAEVEAEIARIRPPVVTPAPSDAATASAHGPAHGPARGPMSAALAAGLHELRDLLAASSLAALDVFTGLRQALAHHDAPAAAAIEDALANLAFAPARERVDTVLQESRP
ncbi:PAS domain S-box protein [Lysobacter sp. H21R4]|uniref:CHASE domain-containing hybrid sensor histidine kinase/response regulator n=1 Tax=Lysobacter sp. H21R4 TaxID=2781021 RepID=UPI001887E336|nr:PAS domain S-box protein [Lysobacter sp. H21R4]QOY62871.1 PAS domain S-box protein [Lysobacter sp. H21R4]